jgi:hypothetical protein
MESKAQSIALGVKAMTVSALGTAVSAVKVVATVESTPAFAASPITVAINGAVAFTTIESSATTFAQGDANRRCDRRIMPS